MADGSDKTAGEIAVGDLVWNPKTKSKAKVLRIVEGPEDVELFEIGFGDTKLKISEEHPETIGDPSSLIQPGDNGILRLAHR